LKNALKFAKNGHCYKKENEEGNGIDNGTDNIRAETLQDEYSKEKDCYGEWEKNRSVHYLHINLLKKENPKI
jgi:hypothetical protein